MQPSTKSPAVKRHFKYWPKFQKCYKECAGGKLDGKTTPAHWAFEIMARDGRLHEVLGAEFATQGANGPTDPCGCGGADAFGSVDDGKIIPRKADNPKSPSWKDRIKGGGGGVPTVGGTIHADGHGEPAFELDDQPGGGL